MDLDREDVPLVSAILPVSRAGGELRVRYARRAVGLFLRQTYARKQLVIANASGMPVWQKPHPAVREVALDPKRPHTIGDLRNAALDQAAGSWVLPWDDDDYYDPHLIAYQVAHRVAGHATLLTTQVRFSGIDVSAYLHHRPEGIASTIFFPRTGARYPSADLGEADGFWIEHWALRTNVVRNHLHPASSLIVAIYHGKNLTPAAEFMDGRTSLTHRGRWELGAAETEALRAALAVVGLRVNFERAAAEDEDAPIAPG